MTVIAGAMIVSVPLRGNVNNDYHHTPIQRSAAWPVSVPLRGNVSNKYPGGNPVAPVGTRFRPLTGKCK